MRECNIFVGIVGHRYGSIAPETEKSFSDSEYDAALASHKRMLMFFAPEEFPVPANLIEPDEVREKQRSFRARVGPKHATGFFEEGQEDILGTLVVQAMHNRRSEESRKGLLFRDPL